MCGKLSLTKFANFLIIVLAIRAEIAITIGSKMVAISTRNTKIQKICELRKAIFSVFHKISRPNFGILLLLEGSFGQFGIFWICLDQKLVYNGNCPLTM